MFEQLQLWTEDFRQHQSNMDRQLDLMSRLMGITNAFRGSLHLLSGIEDPKEDQETQAQRLREVISLLGNSWRLMLGTALLESRSTQSGQNQTRNLMIQNLEALRAELKQLSPDLHFEFESEPRGPHGPLDRDTSGKRSRQAAS
mmetsp:Transcript_24650/g.53581  ORF Transcript_24650/g.53581 Transcript_24650/m.53581 type:complete len:144 (+) Transcript_24650:68-499(+)